MLNKTGAKAQAVETAEKPGDGGASGRTKLSGTPGGVIWVFGCVGRLFATSPGVHQFGCASAALSDCRPGAG
jgi:hypothetical protein